MTYTVEMMVEAFKRNEWEDTCFVLDDGSVACVSPCYYGDKYPNEMTLSDIEFFLVDCNGLPYISNEKLEEVVKTFNNIHELRKTEVSEKEKLRKYFDKHQETGWDDDSFGFYSDWHKDLYGFRPHGYVCGVYVNPHTA